jgi:hypothetical protein
VRLTVHVHLVSKLRMRGAIFHFQTTSWRGTYLSTRTYKYYNKNTYKVWAIGSVTLLLPARFRTHCIYLQSGHFLAPPQGVHFPAPTVYIATTVFLISQLREILLHFRITHKANNFVFLFGNKEGYFCRIQIYFGRATVYLR